MRRILVGLGWPKCWCSRAWDTMEIQATDCDR